MFAYLTGTVENIGESSLVLDVGGTGYELLTSSSTLSRLSGNQSQVKIYTHLQTRDDGLFLFGFFDKEEKEMFLLLINVTGVGPKAAINLLSALSPQQITLAIVTGDVAALSKAQGIGKKTAERLVMELKDKVKGSDGGSALNPQISVSLVTDGAKQDSVDALVSLGYGRSEAVKAVLEVALADMNVETIIKAALRKLV